jgi:hypothetical protein
MEFPLLQVEVKNSSKTGSTYYAGMSGLLYYVILEHIIEVFLMKLCPPPATDSYLPTREKRYLVLKQFQTNCLEEGK